MRRTCIFLVVVSILMLYSSVFADNATERSVEMFFEKYTALGEEFDESVADLYSDNAKISTFRRYPHGLEKAMEIDGAKWKLLVKKAMPLGKAKGDISRFSKIKITLNGTKAKIKADRYSELKCYVDSGYYMVVERDKSGNYQIIEEYMETQPQSDCIKSADGNLVVLMNNAKDQIKGHLPLMVDEETRLNAVNVLGDTFEYVYRMVNISTGELDPDGLSELIRPIVLEQSCNMPNLKPLVNAGGTIAYTYQDKDGKEITSIKINKDDCR